MQKSTERYPTFAGIEPPYSENNGSKIAVVPVPYDLTTTYLAGTKEGPRAIIEASQHMELYDEELAQETYRAGIYTYRPLEVSDKKPEEMLTMVSETTLREMRLGRLQVVVGGEHSVSLGVVRALAKDYPGLSVVQLDAQAAPRDSYGGTPFNHACVGRRMSELCPLVQVGVRSISKEEADFKQFSRVLTVSDYELKEHDFLFVKEFETVHKKYKIFCEPFFL